jgi:acyl dehydratase
MDGYFEDFEPGARYPTRRRTITDADQDAFCDLVEYRVPLFADDAAARERGLPGRICPSHLVMSFSTAMTGDLFTSTIVALVAIDRARFLLPVHPGDTIRTEVEVLEKRETSRPDRGLVVFRDHVYNQHDQEVFCNDKTVLVKRRQTR